MIWFEGINGIARPVGALARRPVRGSGFSVPSDAAAEAAGGSAPESAAEGVSLDGMLALQEAAVLEGQAETVADRKARRHGQDILAELGRLQRALLSGAADSQALARLATLVEQQSPADDPRLRSVLEAVRLRARVELARREAAAER